MFSTFLHRDWIELPTVPNIYVNGVLEYGAVTDLHDEGTDLDLSCEVPGGTVGDQSCRSLYLNKLQNNEIIHNCDNNLLIAKI